MSAESRNNIKIEEDWFFRDNPLNVHKWYWTYHPLKSSANSPKNNKKEKREKKDQHHKMWQCMRRQYNVGIPQNKMIVNMVSHEAFNVLMGNKQNPKQQMEIMYNYRRNWILSDKVNRIIETLLAIPIEEFYIPELYLSS